MDASIPYLGYRISLLSNSDIRYEGTLSGIDSNEATVTLRNVRSMGTEGRVPHREILPSPEIYDCIVFRGQNIKDLTVCGNDFHMDIYQDPAIVSATAGKNGTDNDKLDGNIQNFYFKGNEDSKSSIPRSGGWDDVYHKPAYTAKDLIDKSVNLKSKAKDLSNEEPKFEGKHSGRSDKRGFHKRGKRGGFEKTNLDKNNFHEKGNLEKGNFDKNNFGKTGDRESDIKARPSQSEQSVDKNLKNQFNEEFDFEQANSVFKKEQRVSTATYQHSNFFDNISSDIHEVKEKTSQRKLDFDTFGESANNYKHYRYNNQHRAKRNHRNNNSNRGKKPDRNL